MEKFRVNASSSSWTRRKCGLAVLLVGSWFVLVVPAHSATLPTVTRVTPGIALASTATTLTFSGTGFVATPSVKIGPADAVSVTFVSSTSLTVTSPPDLPAGTYAVTVTNPDGAVAQLTRGFMLIKPLPPLTGLSAPSRIAMDAAGNMFVADPPRERVVALDPKGKVRFIIRVPIPMGVALDGTGNVYIGDGRSGSVGKYDPAGKFLAKLGKGDGQFVTPADIAIHPETGRIYVADAGQDVVKTFGPNGAFLFQFGGPLVGGAGGAGNGKFNQPIALAVDRGRGEVLVGDQHNGSGYLTGAVQIFDLDGNFKRGTGRFGDFGAQQPYQLANQTGRFTRLQGIAVDTEGRIYVADAFQSNVQVVDSDGKFVAVIGQFGTGSGMLRVPNGVLLDAKGRLVIADWNNSRIALFDTSARAASGYAPVVSSVSPARAFRGTSVTTVITGENFGEAATASLQQTGQGPIAGTGLRVVDSTQILVTFDLSAAVSGTWDVVVQNPDGMQGSLPGGFTVVPADFQLALSPASQMLLPGGTTTLVATVTGLEGFDGSVALAGSAPGLSVGLSPSTLRPGDSSVVTVQAGGGASGTYTLTLTGQAEFVSHRATATVRVVQPATLRVSSRPAGGKVYVGGTHGYRGRYQGKTPEEGALTVSGLLPGRQTVRLVKPGHEEVLSTVIANEGETVSLNVTLASKGDRDLRARGAVLVGPEGSTAPLQVPGPVAAAVVDWRARGFRDLLIGDGDGKVHLYLNVAADPASPPAFLDDSDHHQILVEAGPPPSEQGGSSRAIPAIVDWNNDGRKDLLVAEGGGKIRLYLNHGTDAQPHFPISSYLRYQDATGNFKAVEHARLAVPLVVDWDEDVGIGTQKDLLVGDAGGNVWFYRNAGTDSAPVLAAPQRLSLSREILPGSLAPFAVSWKDPQNLDLLLGGQDGRVRLYRNEGRSEPSDPPKRGLDEIEVEGSALSVGADSAPAAVDWDGDGRLDLLVGSREGQIFVFSETSGDERAKRENEAEFREK